MSRAACSLWGTVTTPWEKGRPAAWPAAKPAPEFRKPTHSAAANFEASSVDGSDDDGGHGRAGGCPAGRLSARKRGLELAAASGGRQGDQGCRRAGPLQQLPALAWP